MPCCHEKTPLDTCEVPQQAKVLVDVDTLKASAVGFGFDPSVIADIVEKFGPEALSLVVDALRNGFSLSFVMETVNKFGPAVLEFILSLFQAKTMNLAGNDVSGDLNPLIIQILVEKYLPALMEKYGPQIIKAIVAATVA